MRTRGRRRRVRPRIVVVRPLADLAAERTGARTGCGSARGQTRPCVRSRASVRIDRSMSCARRPRGRRLRRPRAREPALLVVPRARARSAETDRAQARAQGRRHLSAHASHSRRTVPARRVPDRGRRRRCADRRHRRAVPANTVLARSRSASAVALVELAIGLGPRGQQRPIVLLAGDVAELSTGGVVGAETARRLACDATVNGKPIPARRDEQVEARDGYRCTFPGCGKDVFLQCHHIVHRIDGGCERRRQPAARVLATPQARSTKVGGRFAARHRTRRGHVRMGRCLTRRSRLRSAPEHDDDEQAPDDGTRDRPDASQRVEEGVRLAVLPQQAASETRTLGRPSFTTVRGACVFPDL